VTSHSRSQVPLALAALAVVFIVKLSVLLTLGHHPLLVPAGELDGAYYFHFARQVSSGDWLLDDPASFFGRPAPAFFISPLYIYVLALFLKAGGGSLEAARFAQIVLGTAAVGLLGLTARRWFGLRAGWIAGAMATFCGLFTFYEVLILPAALESILTALDLYLLTRALQADGRSPVWAVLAGAALGLHALNRPGMLLVLAGLAILYVVARIGLQIRQIRGRRGFGTQSALPVLAFVLGGVLAISPAAYRNYRVSHQFVPVSSDGGWHFISGNGPQADGIYTPPADLRPTIAAQWIGGTDVVRAAVGHEPTAREVSGYFFGQALAWMRSHPTDELRLIARKMRYALSATFIAFNHSLPFFSRDVRGPLTALVAGPALIVPLGLVGLVVARPRDRSGYWVWASYVPLGMLSVIVFYVTAQARLPYQLALCVTAGGGAAWMLDRVRDRAWQPFGLAALATAVLAAFVAWPTRLDDGRSEEQIRMGLYEIQAGRAVEGEVWIGRGLAKQGYPALVHARAGQLYEAQNQPAAALEHYQKAVALDPNAISIQLAIGRALFAGGKDQEALAPLERARAGPDRDAATRLLVLTYTRLGRHDDASRVVRDLDPNRWTADIAREFADAIGLVGRFDLSIPAWRRAAQASGNAQDYERLGLAWAMINRAPEAVAALSHAVERDPKSASIRLNYAVALAAAGRPDIGRRQAQEALRLDPSYARAKQFLASIK
jgi:tetratricopeptide (TPR) repeat protein